jgi:hypothetical protein
MFNPSGGWLALAEGLLGDMNALHRMSTFDMEKSAAGRYHAVRPRQLRKMLSSPDSPARKLCGKDQNRTFPWPDNQKVCDVC